MATNNGARLSKLEKMQAALKAAAIKAFFDWRTANDTDPETFADFRQGIADIDSGKDPFDPEHRAMLVNALEYNGQPIDPQPGDVELLEGIMKRVPAEIVAQLRGAGLWAD